MPSVTFEQFNAPNPWLQVHPITQEDSAVAAAIRAAAAPVKGKVVDIAGRGPYDELMEQVAIPDGVTHEAALVGGISGWWAKPLAGLKDTAILHAHGGWFNLGTARAYRNFAGHIALSAGANTFVPEYRLAPEHPFPAAVRDLEACYRGLVDSGISRIALTGDSAGGDLALVLLSIASAPGSEHAVSPVGAVVFSPITDLGLAGESFETRAEAEFYFTKPQAAALVRAYLDGSDPKNPEASPLHGDLTNLPPVRIHVGNDEVLLDDSRRYAKRAVAAGVDAKLDVWMGLPHGFVTNMRGFSAARLALSASGAFLAERLANKG